LVTQSKQCKLAGLSVTQYRWYS